jgi:hypothetical protein
MVEGFHRQLKAALRARRCSTVWALLGLRAAPKEDSNVSAAEAVFGTLLCLSDQAVPPPPPSRVAGRPVGGGGRAEIPLRKRFYVEAARGPLEQLAAADFVYIRWHVTADYTAVRRPPRQGVQSAGG